MHRVDAINRPSYRRRRCRPQRGSATIELAICLPLILTVVLGTIEVCQRAFVRQSATIVAYEGARLAVRRTTKSAQLLTRCANLITSRRLNGATISVTPLPIETVPAGDTIRVTITVPWLNNTPVSYVTSSASNISVSAVMVKE